MGGLVISLFYGKREELLVEGVRFSTVNSEIFARVVCSRNFAVKMFVNRKNMSKFGTVVFISYY